MAATGVEAEAKGSAAAAKIGGGDAPTAPGAVAAAPAALSSRVAACIPTLSFSAATTMPAGEASVLSLCMILPKEA